MKHYCRLLSSLWLALVIAGCTVENPPSARRVSNVTYVVCRDRSVAEIGALSAAEAKAILIARAAGIDLSPGGEVSRQEQYEEVEYEVYGTRDGWYVYCHGGWVGDGRTVFVTALWNAIVTLQGAPPDDVTRGAARGRRLPDAPSSNTGAADQFPSRAAEPPGSNHVICTDRSVQQIRMLSPLEAKAILLARSAQVDFNGGGSGGSTYGHRQLIYDVFPLRGGWYVYCHGGWVGKGHTVFVSTSWRATGFSNGPPGNDAVREEAPAEAAPLAPTTNSIGPKREPER